MDMHRRSLLKFTVTSIGAGLAAQSFAQTPARRFDGVTLSMNGYGGDYSRLLAEHVAKPLEARTGLKVSYQNSTVAAAVAKVLASRDNPPFDLIMADSPNIPELIKAGVVEPLTVSEIPNIAKLLPGVREFENFGVPFLTNAVLLTYNSSLVKQPVSSFKDLGRSDLVGRVGWLSPENTAGLLSVIALAESNGGSLANMDPAFQALAGLKKSFATITPATVNLQQLFEQEEVAAGPFWDGRIFAMRAKGKPMVSVVPSEGIYALYNYLVPIKGSKNMNAVKAYINQALADESVGPLVEFFRYAPVTNIAISPAVAKDVVVYGENRQKLRSVDWVKVSQMRGELLDRFNKTMR